MNKSNLEVLVLSKDVQTQILFRKALENLQVKATIVTDGETARRHIEGSVLDGLIVDWESCTDRGSVIQEWQSRMSQSKMSHVLVITSSPQSFTHAMRIAPLVCHRSSSYEGTARVLRSFYSFMMRYRRQSFRHHVNLNAELLQGQQRCSARVLDLSESGAGISAGLSVSVGDEVTVALPLHPGNRPSTLRLRASVIWTSPMKLMGVSFRFADFQQRSVLSNWLIQFEDAGHQNGKAALELAAAG